MSLALVVVAAGTGIRLSGGDGDPKALIEVGGQTLLEHCLGRLASPRPHQVVVVHTVDHRQAFEAICERHDIDELVAGGSSRADSVRAGVAATALSDYVAIHDAARAFAPRHLLDAAVAAVAQEVVDDEPVVAAAPALPVADTLKRVDGWRVMETVDRAGLQGVQTPQVFRRDALRTALDWAGDGHDSTDELALMEAAIATGVVRGVVRVIPGSVWARKVTWPEDLELAELMAQGAPGPRRAPVAAEPGDRHD